MIKTDIKTTRRSLSGSSRPMYEGEYAHLAAVETSPS